MSTLRGSCWSLTINNPTAADEEHINLARQRGWKVEGQLEKGAEGTPHYQLRVSTPQVRFSALKKAFPRGHIELARDPAALGKYVVKEATRVSGLPTGQDAYPSLSKFWELIYRHYNTNDSHGWDCLSLETGTVSFYDDDCDEEFTNTPLVVFDKAVRVLISSGYHVESLAANPSTRSMWKLYARELMARSHNSAQEQAPPALETEDSQTDSVEIRTYFLRPISIPNARCQEDVCSPSTCCCTAPPPPPAS